MSHILSPRGNQLMIGVSLLLIGLNLRPILASVGPLLPSIQQDISLSFALASMLTLLPVLAMGMGCFVGFKIAKGLGFANTVTVSLLFLLIATAMRFWVETANALICSALLAGMGIALIQTLMPTLIKQNFADKTPLMMGLYVTAIMGGAALAASSAPFIAADLGWRAGLGHWTWLALAAILLWIVSRKHLALPSHTDKQAEYSFWRYRRSWLLALFFALGTSCYVCVLAWLAPYAIELGYSQTQAGLALGFLTSMEVIAGLVFPWLASKSTDRRAIIALLCLLQLIGFMGFALAPQVSIFLWAALAGLGIGGIFPLSLIVTMDHQQNPLLAGKLTAFVQGIGYSIAAISPWIAGLIRDNFQSFNMAWLLLAALSVIAYLLSRQFNPSGYAQHYRQVMA
ncbi:cyanate transporter [Shewanella decolorationis]|jgi:CP family cyanate transporter-like MFS transporter|uniref:Cyanate transporter n=1 Tax=Shewanella decolorationis TaxID=256839 RepID=A0A5B8R068_9GAMM|nr:cyanate transporter [Shewanella decolorationis]QDZ91697.1 cyanate transporter [Shewanella decolorationis]